VTAFPANVSYIPLKRVCRANAEGLPEDTAEDLEIAYVDISAVNELGTISKPEIVRFADAPSRARRVVRSGDVLVSTVRTYLKAIAHVSKAAENMICSTGFAVLSAGSGVVPRFLYYWVSSDIFVGEIVSRSVGVSYPAINPGELMGLPFPQLSAQSQAAIADRLDRETSKIDSLIANKRLLIELLDEKRAALISRALTRGIDDSTLTKHSGVVWLERIAKHWRVTRLKFEMRSIEQGWSPQCDSRPAELEEWGVMKVGCVNGGTFDETENKALPSDLDVDIRYEIKSEDLLISRANTRELVGSVALVGTVRPKLLLCDKLYRARVRSSITPRFAALLLQCAYVRHQIEREATGASSSMQNIGQDTIRNLIIVLPPIDEQFRIANWVDEQSNVLLTVRAALQKTIDLLREYRSALITAAVTGQLDIREHEKKLEALA
jgi:type I restriction enzyme S subunit